MSNASFFDDDHDEPRTDYAKGGARPHSGPKKGHRSATPDVPDEKLTDYQRKERASADKEVHLARQAAVKADLDEGSVVYVDMVVNAAARAFSACSQSLDAIPDMLEREGIPLEVTQRVAELINAAKTQLSRDLEKTYSEVQS